MTLKTLILLVISLFATLPAQADTPPAETPAQAEFPDTGTQDEAALRDAMARWTPADAAKVPDEGPTGVAPPREFDAEAELRARENRKRAFLEELNATRATRGKTPVESTVGGDDVLVMSTNSIAQEYAYDLDIAENGDIYVAVQVYYPATGNEIQIYRSTDDGSSFDLIGKRFSADPDAHYRKPSMYVGEGLENRLFVAYEYDLTDNAAFGWSVSVASFDLSLPDVWLVTSPLPGAGIDFRNPDLSGDSMNWHDYRMYVVAEEDDGSANDIWFARTDNYGVGWTDVGEIGTQGGNVADYRKPKVVYGVAGAVHVVWFRGIGFGQTGDDAIRYRRSGDYGQTWNGMEFLTTGNDGFDQDDPTVAADHTTGQVLINFTQVPDGGGQIQNMVRYSQDAGQSWDPRHLGFAPVNLRPHILATPDGYCLWGSRYVSESYGFATTTVASPNSISDAEIMADDTYWGYGIVHHSMLDYDETHGNRVGKIWSERTEGVDRLWFDAEWRADEGYPNHHPNFPVALSDEPATPPAIVDVNPGGHAVDEIVFATKDEKVHVYDRFGQELPGFPVPTNAPVADESLAVGDLNGDGRPEIVVGCQNGTVIAWDSDGKRLSGFPVDLGTSRPVYVSIGTVSRIQKRDIVAVSKDKISLIGFHGQERDHGNWPVAHQDLTLYSAAAIGDLDQDGRMELAVVSSNRVWVYDYLGNSLGAQSIPGTSLSQTPSLGDLDLNGDLEIVVPTDTGVIHVFDHDGTDHPGYPYNTGASEPLTEAAIAEITIGFEIALDIAVGRKDWTAILLSGDGLMSAGWPHQTSPGWFVYGAPIIDDIKIGASDVILGDRGGNANAWYNQFWKVPGWPKQLNGKINVSPATGDIDADGEIEVVFLTENELVVLDVNAPFNATEDRRWPMYGHDAQRTSCADCPVDLITAAGPDVTNTSLFFAPPSPNPSRGNTVFSYRLPVAGNVRLDIYDARGRRVRTLVRAEQGPGEHRIGWDGQDEGSQRVGHGQYFARLSVNGSMAQTRKVVVMP